MFGRMPKLAWVVEVAMIDLPALSIDGHGYLARLDCFYAHAWPFSSPVAVLPARESSLALLRTGNGQSSLRSLLAAMNGANR